MSQDEHEQVGKIELGTRMAAIRNIGIRTDKTGQSPVSMADVALSFILNDEEIDQLVRWRTDGCAHEVLFDPESHLCQLVDMKQLALVIEARGTLTMRGNSEQQGYMFPGAWLRKVVVKPLAGNALMTECTIRIDATGALEALAGMLAHDSCVITFKGERAASQEELPFDVPVPVEADPDRVTFTADELVLFPERADESTKH